ncbi:MAG: cytochrome c biogenesis CcdA family protein [Candidatus Dormibacteraceae bacterium]
MTGPWLPLLAVAAGVLSFSSPCILPLIPGYLGYMSGVASTRGRTLGAAVLFVLGFTLVFTALGAAASSVGSVLNLHRVLLEQIAGVLVVLLGLFLIGIVRLPVLMREGRPLLGWAKPGPGGAFLLGIGFAFGWTPCIGPVLGAILILASGQSTVASGTLLLLVYSLGLGVPFLLTAVLLDRFRGVRRWLGRHGRVIDVAGGALLIAMGVLMFTDSLDRVFAPALQFYTQLRWPPI